MHNNKVILGYCPNFDKIVNNDFLEDDIFSLQLVKIYKDFIFKIDIYDEAEVKKVREIDYIMGKYVDDYLFRKNLQREIAGVKVKRSARDVILVIVEAIIDIFRKYELESTRKIYISRWI